jgi:hypothetical protein
VDREFWWTLNSWPGNIVQRIHPTADPFTPVNNSMMAAIHGPAPDASSAASN